MHGPMRHRVLASALVLAVTVGAAAALTCGPEPDPMAELTPKVEAHRLDTVRDSFRLEQLRYADSVAAAAQARIQATARVAAARATAAQQRADRLAAEAARARSLADSARGWEVAYVARTEEAGELRTALAAKQVEVDTANARLDRHARRDSIQEARHARDLALLNDAVAAAVQGGRRKDCRVLWMPCPSRTAVAVAGVVGGVLIGSGAGARLVGHVGEVVGRM